MLGSRKFLIVLFSCFVVGSVFVVGLVAEDVARELSPSPLRSYTNPDYRIDSSGYDKFSDWLEENGYLSSSTAYSFSSPIYLYVPSFPQQSQYANNFYYDSVSDTIYARFSSSFGSIDSEFYQISFDGDTRYWFFADTVGLTYDDFVFRNGSDALMSSTASLGTTVLAVGSSLISFVTSSWVTIVALVAVLLVLGVGVIRKLVKGV